MKEFKAIINAYRKIDFNQRKAALATVVKVQGSSYRSPGARMLITDDGHWVGSISGGCLEGDALRKARQVMSTCLPVTVTYDTHEESNQQLGIGLGCNGIITVLIESIDPTAVNNSITLFDSLLDIRQPVALATVFNTKAIAERFLLTENRNQLKRFSDEDLNKLIEPELFNLFHSKKSETKKFKLKEYEVEVFLEFIQPAISIIIFGGGFDARPVSELAKSLGWNVIVTDECVAHIAPIFFPNVDKLALCNRQYIDRDFEITDHTACILMSHNYEYDRDVLCKLLNTDAPYIGILGPRKRFDKMKDELKIKNIEFRKNDTHRIHSPIGLDIGAETPDEIALAIVSEIQSKFTNRSGGFLKYRTQPIHYHDQESDQVFKQVYMATQPRSVSV